MKLKTDGDKAIHTLNQIHRICLDHLGQPDVDPNVTVSRIIAWLDPWPLSTRPGRFQTDRPVELNHSAKPAFWPLPEETWVKKDAGGPS